MCYCSIVKSLTCSMSARKRQSWNYQKKYGSVCRKVARNILNNDLDAEECVNDAFLGAWNTIPPQNPNPLLTYICRIVRNLSIKKYHANTAIKRNSFYDAALDELGECLAAAANVETELAAKELRCY
jgi:DNA-directed RNA polymerase specialized sigma24 family protein